MKSESEFRQEIEQVFPGVKIHIDAVAHKATYDTELRALRMMSRKTWLEVTFDDCIDAHDCLALLTPEAVAAYLPAFMLHTWDVAEADFLLEYLLSWLADADGMHGGHQFSMLNREQREAVCAWLHHVERVNVDELVDVKLLAQAIGKWECSVEVESE